MRNIYGLTFEELEEYFISIGDKKFRANQVYDWIYKKRINKFDDMLNVKKDVIERLKTDFYFGEIKILTKRVGKDVIKFLFELSDFEKIEAVVMLHDYGNSLCVSTQVGCNMGCTFCESGRLKKVRNLNTEEMVMQVLKIESELKFRISHVVLMGIGEPFDNYDNVIKFIDIINCGKGIDIGSRHITVSTCGIIPKIKEFMKLKSQVNLAISLHAPNDELRSKLMKINKVYPLKDLIEVLKEYISVTNRRVTFEYILLEDINDTSECALELSNLIKGMNAYVNLIPYNETNTIGYKKSSKKHIDEFYNILKKNNINVTVRREFGSEVSAACGQLRANYK